MHLHVVHVDHFKDLIHDCEVVRVAVDQAGQVHVLNLRRTPPQAAQHILRRCGCGTMAEGMAGGGGDGAAVGVTYSV